MSLILDAVNRSRQEADQPPGVAAQHYIENDGAQAKSWRGFLPWLALLVALMVIGWLVLERGPRPVAPVDDLTLVAPAASPPGRPTGRTTPGSQPPPEVVEAVPGAAVRESIVATVDPAATAEAPAAVPPEPGSAVADLYQRQAREPDAARPARESVAQQDIESATQPAAQAQESTEQEQPVDIEKVILQAREELKDARLKEHPAPLIAELSQQTKDRIPTIYYERHDYAGNQARSVVVLNGKSLKVGGSAASGVKVDEILPDSVVLNFRGTQFRLRALNSWINL